MKKLLKNKKFIIGFIIIIIIILLLTISLLCKKDNKEDKQKLKNGTFTAYVKINPLVKLTFKSSYYECGNKICGKYTNEVTKVELLNDDATSIYKNLNLKGKSLNDSIISLILIANDNKYDVSNVSVTTNWNYDLDNINKNIIEQLKTKNKITVELKFNYQKQINENSLLEKKDDKTYTVKFDTDGGSNIDSQTINYNETIKMPNNPTKEGYTFIEWQLDGKSFDFNSRIDKNITLKAKWNKNSENNNSNKKNNEPTLSKKEQDNEILKKQLKEKGLTWDTSDLNYAQDIITKWSGGYNGEIIENSYGESDIAYTIQITLNASACGKNEILNIDWRNNQPIDFIYYLHSLGYNCSGNRGYYNNKHFVINEKNEIIFE